VALVSFPRDEAEASLFDRVDALAKEIERLRSEVAWLRGAVAAADRIVNMGSADPTRAAAIVSYLAARRAVDRLEPGYDR